MLMMLTGPPCDRFLCTPSERGADEVVSTGVQETCSSKPKLVWAYAQHRKRIKNVCAESSFRGNPGVNSWKWEVLGGTVRTCRHP